jgi:hypothetical protein
MKSWASAPKGDGKMCIFIGDCSGYDAPTCDQAYNKDRVVMPKCHTPLTTDSEGGAEVALDCGVKHPCQRIENYEKVCGSEVETKEYEIMADREAYIMINVKVYLCPQCVKEISA